MLFLKFILFVLFCLAVVHSTAERASVLTVVKFLVSNEVNGSKDWKLTKYLFAGELFLSSGHKNGQFTTTEYSYPSH